MFPMPLKDTHKENNYCFLVLSLCISFWSLLFWSIFIYFFILYKDYPPVFPMVSRLFQLCIANRIFNISLFHFNLIKTLQEMFYYPHFTRKANRYPRLCIKRVINRIQTKTMLFPKLLRRNKLKVLVTC